MSDSIEYCDTCPIQVGCHMARKCLDPKCTNQEPEVALDDASCSDSSIPVHEREWFRRIKNYHYTLYVNDPPQLEWDGEKWIPKTNAPTVRATN